ncbi:hypothetical protein COT50_02395 [candidate division WWE3 bacterium CG08_land_8_20_14_0_20_41_10]|uniref:DUF2079 domain-containing protein n=1 Tax=candidate division WWE3 bacterium CG08_land_8_20_14_0_20_41_10 TaxID=1975085 RepID=A0A2H0XBR7_UNCKA|nr:MAG: hypothetical protein COT50_02395 [candidate division WWE3 bacterium CG08_land_8_20_14_0_20_41_10]
MLAKTYHKINKELLGMLIVLAISTAVCVISVRINIFRYNNFDFGKFDLGNMTQMVWNTLQGRPLYLTDYFGGNVPRWSMSHVDPILLLFVPLFALIPHPLTLVFAQLFLTTLLAPLVLFKIAKITLKSNLAATLLAVAYLFYPALGYLNTQTGFHGVSVAIPFFLLAFYFLEKKKMVGLWICAIITMSGKEQLPLYIIFLCVFGLLYRVPFPQNAKFPSTRRLRDYFKQSLAKNLVTLLLVSSVWLAMAFFVIIPQNAHYRITSYTNFTQEVSVDTKLTSDVIKENYFLGRYQDLGDSYGSILLGMATDPKRLVNILFGGDKLDNFSKTFAPSLYLPFFAPQIIIMAIPDLVINYATTAGGIGTAEISNHRISMITPVIFLSIIFAIATLSKFFGVAGVFFHAYPFKRLWKMVGLADFSKTLAVTKNSPPRLHNYTVNLLATAVLMSNIYTTYKYNNPVFLWLTQAVSKRVSSIAYAKFDREVGLKQNLKLGDRFKISGLENKDRECAQIIMDIIPPTASISGPDYLGAHLAQRETYAIFPALYSKADYVIVDVFSQKIMRILDTDVSMVRDVVGDMITNPNYQNVAGCGNLFVFKKGSGQTKSLKLPMQERYKYEPDQSLEIFEDLFLANFEIPKTVTRGKPSKATFVYRKESKKPDEYVIFTSFINSETGEIFQSANIPSYGLINIKDWSEGHYYIEGVDLTVPTAVGSGIYRAFIGMTNNIRTRSIYLGDMEVR